MSLKTIISDYSILWRSNNSEDETGINLNVGEIVLIVCSNPIRKNEVFVVTSSGHLGYVERVDLGKC